MSRSLVYLGVGAASLFSYIAIEWVAKKAFRYLRPLETSHRTLIEEIPAPVTG